MLNQSREQRNQKDICLLYVICFHALLQGEIVRWEVVCCYFFFLPFEIFHLSSQDNSMTDPMARGRKAWQKCFCLYLQLKIAQERSCSLPNIWPHVSALAGSKGIRACGSKCLCVSGGTPLYFQASVQPSTRYSHLNLFTDMCTQWPSRKAVFFSFLFYFSLQEFCPHNYFHVIGLNWQSCLLPFLELSSQHSC